MKFSVFQLSRIGGREKNEDRMGYCYTRESGLFLLADGMGGHPDGEIAAQLALESMSAFYQKNATPRVADPRQFLEDAILAAHRHVLAYATKRSMIDTPRTTLVAVFVQDSKAIFAHCGDSRAYLVRNNELVTRTRDHSYLEQQNAGIIKLEMVNRNVLFTCLGSPTRPIFDISEPMPLRQGDKVLLCSDGLWGALDDDVIVLKLGLRPVSDAVPELVDLAIHRGGERCDNTTVIAMEWETPNTGDSSGSISTDSISDGVFATTIQGTNTEQDLHGLEELDDAAIERSIAEINEAIRRTAERKKQ